MDEKRVNPLKVIKFDRKEKPKEMSPKEAVIHILEDYIAQLKTPDHPDPGFLIIFTDAGRATYNINDPAEYVGVLQMEMYDFMNYVAEEGEEED